MSLGLSILCVTQGLPRVAPILQHFRDVGAHLDADVVILQDGVDVHSQGFLESVLDEALTFTHQPYVLRLDDDEKMSDAMVRWLHEERFRDADNWHFPRVHLWGNPWTALIEPFYFPDWQTRLSTREKFGRGNALHAHSPHAAFFAPVAIEHWNYLTKTFDERMAIAANYLRLVDGDVSQAGGLEQQKTGDVLFAHYTSGYLPLNENNKVTWDGATWRGPLSGTRK